jgi:sugar-specific transcriptional regulator TrmB/DNA-binding CsgD family transcriptional regulator
MGEDEDIVYQYLLVTKPATAEDIRAGTGLRLARARQALARLQAAGFARRLPDEPARFAAAPPQAVNSVIKRKLTDLRDAQDKLGELSARYQATQLEAEAAGIFEVVKSADAIRERTLEMVASARIETLNMAKLPAIAVHSREHVEPDEQVHGRIIFDQALVKDEETLNAIRASEGTHYEVRMHASVPVKMLAVDRQMAILPVRHDEGNLVAVVIRESDILDSFLVLFDYIWDTATTLQHLSFDKPGESGRSPLTPDDRFLLSLLLAGLTDQAIARHLGVSVRTIERRVKAMMNAAGVRTRTQLVWESARHHWLGADGDLS